VGLQCPWRYYAEIDRCDIALLHPLSFSSYRLIKINQRSPIVLTTTRLLIWSIMNLLALITTETKAHRAEMRSIRTKGTRLRKKSVSREIVRTLSFAHSTKFTIINYYVQKILYLIDRVSFLSRYEWFRDSTCSASFLLFFLRLTRFIALRGMHMSYGATWIKY